MPRRMNGFDLSQKFRLISGRTVTMAQSKLASRLIRIALLSAVALVGVVGGTWWITRQHADQIQSGRGGTTIIGQQLGGSFQMTNHLGQTVTEASFQGKFPLYFFGFTFCPDICPTELLTIAQTLESLPPELASVFQPIFVTVDPARDTAEVMAEYVTQFHPSIIGLTGTQQQMADMAKKWRVYYTKRGEDEYYTMDHSAFLYLMDKQGVFIDMFPNNLDADALAARLTALVQPRL